MTRIAVLADIHGNLPALEAVIDDMAQFGVNQVVVAGDVINCGPFSAAVTARVHTSGWAVVRGNNEFYLLDYRTDRAPAQWADFTLIPWLHRQLHGHWQNVIAAWPDTLSLRYPDAPPLRVCHGTPRSPWESIFPDTPDDEVVELLTGVEETTVIAAHTHLPLERRVGDWHLLNPGSVGMAVNGTQAATYLLLDAVGDGWHATLRHVDYDDTELFAEFERQRFVEEYGAAAHLIVEEFRTARLHLYPFARWRAAQHPDEPESMALVEQFTAEDRWTYTPEPYHINREPVPA